MCSKFNIRHVALFMFFEVQQKRGNEVDRIDILYFKSYTNIIAR